VACGCLRDLRVSLQPRCRRAQAPANWCDIVSLHLNVKAATYRELPGDWLSPFTSAAKSTNLRRHASVIFITGTCSATGYLDIILSAMQALSHKGPQNEVEALPLEGGRTFCPRQLRIQRQRCTSPRGQRPICQLGRDKVGSP